jgi:hypothetical protein
VAVGVLVEVSVGSGVSVTAGVTVKTRAGSTVPADVADGSISSVGAVVGSAGVGSGVGSPPTPQANAATSKMTKIIKIYFTQISSVR